MTTYANGIRKPSGHLSDVLTGAVPVDQAHESIRLALDRVIYNRAEHVLGATTREDRRARLAKVEAPIRDLVEAEAKRLFESRKAKR